MGCYFFPPNTWPCMLATANYLPYLVWDGMLPWDYMGLYGIMIGIIMGIIMDYMDATHLFLGMIIINHDFRIPEFNNQFFVFHHSINQISFSPLKNGGKGRRSPSRIGFW